MALLNYEGLKYYHSKLVEWINAKHDDTKTASEAKLNTIDNVVYFTTDTNEIYLNGVCYGGSTFDLSSYVTKQWIEDKHYLTSIPADYVTQSELKTINGQSIVGSGNIEIEGGGTFDPTILDDYATQTWVSQQNYIKNIKTINGESLIGTGDIVLNSGGSGNGVSASDYEQDQKAIAGVLNFLNSKLIWQDEE